MSFNIDRTKTIENGRGHRHASRASAQASAQASAATAELDPQIGELARLSDGSKQGQEEAAGRELRKQFHCGAAPCRQ